MHAQFVTPWLQDIQPLTNVHEIKWTPGHVKRENDVAQSYTSSAFAQGSALLHALVNAHVCSSSV